MNSAITKLVELNDEEEYLQWLFERQQLGIIINGVGNVVMLGCYLAAYFWVAGWGLYTSYLVYSIGGVALITLVADIFALFLAPDDLDSWAEISWYLQAASVVFSVLVALWGFVVLFWNAGWSFSSLFVGTGLYINLFLIIGSVVGLGCGVYGGLLDLASLGIYNYNEYGVEGEFDGEDISDEISLSMSY